MECVGSSCLASSVLRFISHILIYSYEVSKMAGVLSLITGNIIGTLAQYDSCCEC
jgi:hypothetical protein